MPTWPETLPSCPLASGYSEAPKSQVLRSSMDAGPPKSRRRFTAALRTVSVQLVMSKVQLAEFEAWFDADIQGGALPFNWTQPRTDEVVSVVIVGDPPYQIAPLGNSHHWTLSMQLEIQP